MIRCAVRLLLGAAILGCLGARVSPEEGGPSPLVHLDEIRARHALQVGEASSALEVLRGQGVSAHLVQVRTRVRPHFHRDHEETAYVLEGKGVFVVGDRAYPVKPGSLMIVPRGIVHGYEAREPTVVLALYDPPFDPADRIFVDESKPAP